MGPPVTFFMTPGQGGRWPTGIGMTLPPCRWWSGKCCRWSRWVAG